MGLTKEEFVKERTRIMSKMLDNPDENGIFPTTVAYAELDDLYDQMNVHAYGKSGAQKLRDGTKNEPHGKYGSRRKVSKKVTRKRS